MILRGAAHSTAVSGVMDRDRIAWTANNRMQEATWQGRHDKGVKARRGSG